MPKIHFLLYLQRLQAYFLSYSIAYLFLCPLFMLFPWLGKYPSHHSLHPSEFCYFISTALSNLEVFLIFHMLLFKDTFTERLLSLRHWASTKNSKINKIWAILRYILRYCSSHIVKFYLLIFNIFIPILILHDCFVSSFVC